MFTAAVAQPLKTILRKNEYHFLKTTQSSTSDYLYCAGTSSWPRMGAQGKKAFCCLIFKESLERSQLGARCFLRKTCQRGRLMNWYRITYCQTVAAWELQSRKHDKYALVIFYFCSWFLPEIGGVSLLEWTKKNLCFVTKWRNTFTIY